MLFFFGGPYLIMLFKVATLVFFVIVVGHMYYGDLLFLDMPKIEIMLLKDTFNIKL